MGENNRDNKESRARLIECAKNEFLEKGFIKASLRKIAADAGVTTGAVYFFFNHDEFAEKLVNVIYDNFDEMTILLERSAGSKYEGVVEQIIDKLDLVYVDMAERYAALMPGKHANREMLHWLTHVQIDAFIHMMNHFTDGQEAMRFIKPVMDYLIKGWITYALEDDE